MYVFIVETSTPNRSPILWSGLVQISPYCRRSRQWMHEKHMLFVVAITKELLLYKTGNHGFNARYSLVMEAIAQNNLNNANIISFISCFNHSLHICACCFHYVKNCSILSSRFIPVGTFYNLISVRTLIKAGNILSWSCLSCCCYVLYKDVSTYRESYLLHNVIQQCGRLIHFNKHWSKMISYFFTLA